MSNTHISSVMGNNEQSVAKEKGSNHSPATEHFFETMEDTNLKSRDVGDLTDSDEEPQSPWQWARNGHFPVDLNSIAT